MKLRTVVGFLFVALLTSGWVLFGADNNIVDESWSVLKVRAEAPIPKEIENEAAAQKVAQEAAVTWGQNQILTYILKKKTHSGKILAVVETPSLELQKEIRDYVKTAKPENVEFTNKICRLNLVLPKSPLKTILRKN